MLLSFRVANHRSIREEQHLLLTPQYEADRPEHATWTGVPVIGIFGPNAAGKSNILDALRYMRSMVVGSHRESEPGGGVLRTPFALDPAMRSEPSSFVVDLLHEEVRYTYGFQVDDERILNEWLYAYQEKQRNVLFERNGDEYNRKSQSPDTVQKVADITASNVLFLSVAARSRQDLVLPVYSWFTGLSVRPSFHFWTNRPGPLTPQLEDEAFRDRLTTLLRAADLGIQRLDLQEPDAEELATIAATLGDLPEEVRRLRLRTMTRRMSSLMFEHRGAVGAAALPMRDQSMGTQALFDIGISALGALDNGRVLAIDELDASLHSYLSAEIIRLFREPATNPHGAQLIFTSHDATLLGRIQGDEVLKRDHIWFVEKNEEGATELYPLSDFKPRKEENRERRYLAGRYGAVPNVQDEMFAAALASRRDIGDDAP